MVTNIRTFLSAEDGAVTLDWVVLTAAVCGLGFAVIATIAGGAVDQSTGLGAYLQSNEPMVDW